MVGRTMTYIRTVSSGDCFMLDELPSKKRSRISLDTMCLNVPPPALESGSQLFQSCALPMSYRGLDGVRRYGNHLGQMALHQARLCVGTPTRTHPTWIYRP